MMTFVRADSDAPEVSAARRFASVIGVLTLAACAAPKPARTSMAEAVKPPPLPHAQVEVTSTLPRLTRVASTRYAPDAGTDNPTVSDGVTVAISLAALSAQGSDAPARATVRCRDVDGDPFLVPLTGPALRL